ncbi:MAG: preprotein translocase subunit SecG [Patescibacteria group bacterium]|nr:preprotein translocase subunit SecG [Patescibacteria group bacterium]MDE2588648.1 preprotein translocase subunit SecG [Patescibacteria group bacterium]
MILVALQVVFAVLLIASILMQMQGTGLTSSFGGSGEFYRSKRSVEKLLIYATVVLAILFAGTSIVLLIFPR